MAISLSDAISSKREPKRSNRWVLKFRTIPGLDKQELSDQLSFDLLSASRPTLNFAAEASVHRLNEEWKFATKPTWNPITVVFYDFDAGEESAMQILWKWSKKIYDVLNGTMGYAAEYKTDASLVLLGPGQAVNSGAPATANIEIIEAWDLFGCFPNNLTTGDLSYDGASALQVSMELYFDYANLHEAPAGSAGAWKI